MKLKNIVLGSLCVFPAMYVHAAAMDQSGQSILAFLESGNYAEGGLIIGDPNISGKLKNRPELLDDPKNQNTGDMASSFNFYNFALKFQLTDDLSFGILYDQPFGAKISYPGVWGAMEPKTNVSSESHRKGAFRSPAHPPGITL